MINTNELCACLAKRGLSRADGAKIIGVSPKTFYSWLAKRTMPTDKAELLIEKLEIEDPVNIFFDGKLPVA
jgi:transcriptional regulator with XRE-family HTH domain